MKGDADQDAAEAVVAGTRAVKRVSRFMPNEARVERGLLVVSRKAIRGPTVELCKASPPRRLDMERMLGRRQRYTAGGLDSPVLSVEGG